MKYYLLTFNEDYADEHDVPALACFNEKQFNKWKKTESGILTKNLEEKKKAYRAKQKAYDDYWKLSTAKREKVKQPEYYSPREAPQKLRVSGIRAHLGNSGDGFEGSFRDLFLMEEFIKKGYVEVTEVDANFYKIFNKARLSDLSLSNIFDEDFEVYDYNEDEEDE